MTEILDASEASEASGTSDARPTLRRLLRDELKLAMRRRDKVAVSALRTTIAAVDNAEAVEVEAPVGGSSLAVEQSPLGVGAAEAQRKVLTEGDVEEIVRAELAERRRAAEEYDGLGRPEHAQRLREEFEVLSAVLRRVD